MSVYNSTWIKMHIEIPRSLALSKRITAILTAKNEHFVCNELHCRKIFVLYCRLKNLRFHQWAYWDILLKVTCLTHPLTYIVEQ